jgi:uncharacterized protein
MNTETKQSLSITPTSPSNRILSLDVLRGFALFGILVVNIQVFAMIFAALMNRTAFGDLTGFNYLAALFTYVLAEQKFMTLFSLLFGAGILMMAGNLESRGSKPAGTHYRRMGVLILIGLMHGLLLWYGDILFSYGICGMIIYLFRKLSAKKLLIIGLISISITSLLLILLNLSLPHWPEDLLTAARNSWQPGQELIAREIAAYQGGWSEQMVYRVPTFISMQTQAFLLLTLWRTCGVMLMGMALFKWGILTAKASKKLYRNFLIIGLGVGLPIIIIGWILNSQHHWGFDYSMFQGMQFNYWGSLFLSLAYIGGVMLICRASKLPFITRALAAGGRMAFTNYLMQSVICTFIFYGHGLGLFGKVSRTGQILLVFLIYVLQLWLSQTWLKYFRFGPVEWLWRSLTYKKMQPMRNVISSGN